MKNFITACMALMALAAFALPATASATNEPDLTNGGGVPVGGEVFGTGTNTEFQTTAGGTLVTCSNATMGGEVKENAGGSVKIELTGAEYSGTGSVHSHNGLKECTGTFGNAYITVTNLPLCYRSDPTMATDEFWVSGGSCAGAANKVKYLIGSTTAGECEYESTNSITGNYATGGGQADLTVHNTQPGSGSTKIRGGFLCPSSGKLKMTFLLENGGGQNLTFS